MGWVRPLSDIPASAAKGKPAPTPAELAHAAKLKQLAQKLLDMHSSGKVTEQQLEQFFTRMGFDPLEGYEEDLTTSFTAPQVAVLRALSDQLRGYAREVGHYHAHGRGPLGTVRMPASRPVRPPRPRMQGAAELSGIAMLARMRAHARAYKQANPGRRVRAPARMTALPISGWEPDSDAELGFLPALGGIVSTIAGPLISGLFGGGGDSKQSAPAPAPAAAQQPQVVLGGQANGNLSLPAIGGVIADQIRAVPPPVRQQVTDAIREALDRTKAGQQDVSQLLKDITGQLGPGLKAQLDAVNQAALQRQATFEHETLNKSEERWKSNADAQKRILARLDAMESKLGNAVTSRNARARAVARAYGVAPRYLP